MTGRQDFTGRIVVEGGTTQNTGTMTIKAGTIAITPSGDLTMGSATSNVAIKCTDHFMIGANATARVVLDQL